MSDLIIILHNHFGNLLIILRYLGFQFRYSGHLVFDYCRDCTAERRNNAFKAGNFHEFGAFITHPKQIGSFPNGGDKFDIQIIALHMHNIVAEPHAFDEVFIPLHRFSATIAGSDSSHIANTLRCPISNVDRFRYRWRTERRNTQQNRILVLHSSRVR